MKKLIIFSTLFLFSAALHAGMSGDFAAKANQYNVKYFTRDIGAFLGANDYIGGPWDYGVHVGAGYSKMWGDNDIADPQATFVFADFYKLVNLRFGTEADYKSFGGGISFLHPLWSGIEGAYGGIFYDYAETDTFEVNHMSVTIMSEIKALSEEHGPSGTNDFSFNTYLKLGADITWLRAKNGQSFDDKTSNIPGIRASLGSTFFFPNLAPKTSSLNLAPALTAEYTYTGKASVLRGALSIVF